MTSSGSSANTSDSNPHRWGEILGTVIALITLTLPLFAIAQYSSTNNLDVWQEGTYSLPSTQK
ncbi:MAG TPA: hypothetical protein DEG17_14970 [Cyanobacteria bacterium UBA11149]|nr:hypothetical protein [Cyanobacteria bacterium UBA11366]HBK65819.1 hypothetical protein [Cyanobacteria bacterium UBA11166]HBR75898.1 hypothetical protein [Cyanobacteria bacterium UBA11159]HBS68189.1 hypothetical protein [Cyanobacteria bacterium UBA11153]HBW90136.1 hypothetical protein [Cyanobacteria bacterium UBA11149]HCA94347.1 hypothetical protein [Cyanobacteria bacterium UBA9226]